MKNIAIFILTFTIVYSVNGQGSVDSSGTRNTTLFETAPIPKGGEKEFHKFLDSNLQYPKDARKQRKQGEVLVEFVVSSDGNVIPESVRIAKGVFKSLDDEALRVIRLSPKWTPGTRNGTAVEMRMVMPINFSLRH